MTEDEVWAGPPQDDGYTDADLAPHGWSPGGYMGPCRECAGSAFGAKRVRVCRSCAVKALVAARAVTPAVPEPVEAKHTTPSGIVVEFRQHDFMPGFAAYLHQEGTPFPDGKAFCAIDLSALLLSHSVTDGTSSELAETVADTMVHEVIHVIEAWAGVEFSEARVEGLIARYRGHATTAYDGGYDGGMDFSSALYLARTEGARIRRKSWSAWRHVQIRVGLASEFLAHEEGAPWDAPSEDMLAEDWEVAPS